MVFQGIELGWVLMDTMQNGALTLECSVESMELGEGNFTAVVVVRDEALYQRTDPQVVSEVSLTLRVFVAPRSALIVFHNTDVQVSVLAGEAPTHSGAARAHAYAKISHQAFLVSTQ